MITFRKAATIGLALAASGVVLAGCASAPTTTTPSDSPAPTVSAVAGFKPCMISDSGGFDDHSFNELGANGIEAAATELGLGDISKTNLYESKTDADYQPNIDSAISAGCSLIITVGFNLSADTVSAALANPSIQFAIVDDAADNDFDGKTDAPNIKPILFDTAQAAFLGGYAAASYSKAHTLGTYGDADYPTVYIFMDGFAQGAKYYDSVKGTTTKVVGYSETEAESTFGDGTFSADATAKTISQGLIDQGADVILPVGGPDYQATIAAIKDSGKDIAVLGVDSDTYVTDPSYGSSFLTSVRKLIDAAVHDTVISAGTGNFDVTPYVGTLANGGVGIADFHDYASKVDPALQGELDSIKADIISGKIKVTSYLSK